MHHLQIMESLGGDSLWLDRFMAQHGAIVYYWVLIGFFFFFPSVCFRALLGLSRQYCHSYGLERFMAQHGAIAYFWVLVGFYEEE